MRNKESEEESKEESKKYKTDIFSKTPLLFKEGCPLGRGGSDLSLIETHISRVYLTPKFAYKQKKPVNFGFVDYTTLEKRIFFAKKELSLNRRGCSGIYIDLVELRQKKGRLFTGFKGGRLMDVFVRMRRINSDRFLNNILKSGEPDKKIDGILKKAAKKIYLFHKNAGTSKRISQFGNYGVYKANWDDNYETIKEYYRKIAPFFNNDGSQASPDGAVASYPSFLSSPLFSEFIRLRAEGGFVRDVHGDLRMEHIDVRVPAPNPKLLTKKGGFLRKRLNKPSNTSLFL